MAFPAASCWQQRGLPGGGAQEAPQGPARAHLHVECSVQVLCVLVAREVEDAAEAGTQEAALPLLWKQPRTAVRGERAEA